VANSNPYAKAAITGVGYTSLVRASGRSVLDLALDACRAAAQDAGIDARDVDGIVTFQYLDDSVPAHAVGAALGVRELRHALDSGLAGQAPCYLTAHAAQMISAGIARHVLVFRALNGRSGQRVGRAVASGIAAEMRHRSGLVAYAQTVALWARRFMIETGATEEDLAAIVLAQRQWAVENERATRRGVCSMDDYFAAPYVAEPFRTVDCTIEVDGACAILVSSLDAARDLRQPAVTIQAGVYTQGSHAGLDMADMLTWPDLSRNYTSHLAERLWGMAGVRPADVDVAELYDCFSSTVLFAIEGLGFAERGGAGDFVRGGALPFNTNGGLLCEGYVHGMTTVAEAVLQLQGRCASRQVPDAELAVVTSGALQDGSALVLGRSR
jgi:acetyl-CoA acetyltransferase